MATDFKKARDCYVAGLQQPDGSYKLEPLDAAVLAEWDADPGRLNILCTTLRPGAASVWRLIENTLYPPNTAANLNFIMGFYTWEELDWTIVRVPLQDRGKVEALIESVGWRLVNGTLHVMHRGELRSFPMKSRRTWGLEPKHKGAGPHIGVIAATGPGGPAVVDPRITRAADAALQAGFRRDNAGNN